LLQIDRFLQCSLKVVYRQIARPIARRTDIGDISRQDFLSLLCECRHFLQERDGSRFGENLGHSDFLSEFDKPRKRQEPAGTIRSSHSALIDDFEV
jgi:hypothetical protein